MSSIITPPQDFRPRLLRQIDAYPGPGFVPQNASVHPKVICAVAWRRLIEAINRFLDTHLAITPPPSAGVDSPLRIKEFDRERDDYEQVVYRVVEFYEAICQTLRDSLCTPTQAKSWAPVNMKGIRRHHATICNKLKHEGRVMVISELQTFLFTSRGFGIYAAIGAGPQAPDANVHSRLHAFSYRADLANMIWGTFAMAEAVADEITKLGGPADGAAADDAFTRNVFMRTAGLPIGPFPGEKPTNTASLQISGGSLHLSQTQATLVPVMGSIKASTWFIADGHSKSFTLPWDMRTNPYR